LLGYIDRDSYSQIFRINEDLWVLIVALFSILFPLATIALILKEERKAKVSKKRKEPIPSTPYQCLLHAVSVIKWCIPVCSVCIIALATLAVFARDELIYRVYDMEITIRNSGPFLVRGLLFMYIFALIIFLFAFKEINMPYRKLHDTIVDSMNRGTLKKDTSSTYRSVLKRLADKLGLNPPTLLIAKKFEDWMPSVSFALAGPKEDVSIVIDEDYLSSLSKKELESILAHELWHIKAGYTEFLLTVYERGFALYFLGTALFFVCGIMSIFAVMLASGTIPWPYLLTDEFGMPMPLLSNPVLFVISAFPEVFGNLLIIRSLVIDPKLFMFMATDPVIEEYFADSMSGLTTEEPHALISGILKEFNASMPSTVSVNITEYSNMLQPSLLKGVRLPTLRDRIKNAFFINDLLKNEWSLQFEKGLKGFSLHDFFGFSLSLYFSPFSRTIDQMSKEKIKRIYNFIVLNSQNFNLRKCSQGTDSSLCECFAVLACLLMVKRIRQSS
jgi:Zn-dependent protease with chaperone function